ncbi:hypothetical protein QFC19_002545 [Naganishia cerealis]|uniref:Uncharacterized protein n=1 Tax=Naganishia cerealis TaxID=610337 RepID=A0ACC2W9T4_9TREE|nr:hypothetical protein QFC19_002545 [Naganishia cerealis]
MGYIDISQITESFAPHQYSRAYYRATYISTAFDAGFVTAMTIRPKWMRDICSVALSGYYLIYAQEADEKVSAIKRGATKRK